MLSLEYRRKPQAKSAKRMEFILFNLSIGWIENFSLFYRRAISSPENVVVVKSSTAGVKVWLNDPLFEELLGLAFRDERTSSFFNLVPLSLAARD